MAGICSYGAYVPPNRLAFATIAGKQAPEKAPERSVAWNDEDSVTMGVAAAISCLAGFERDSVDAVLFASTTYPFREKQGASLIARALDLRRDIRTQDHGGSLRAGTAALRTAADAVSAGSARSVLVIASDCRTAAPGTGLESALGDGAAAFLVGEHDPIAKFDDWYAVSDEIVDVWRAETDRFVHSWEDRFVVQEGYMPRLVEAVRALLERTDRAIGDFDRLALYAPDRRSHATAMRKLGAQAEQATDPLFGRLGNAGTAFAPLLLASALEQAQPGERILVSNYGDGADAAALEVTEHIEKLGARRGVGWHLERRRRVASYDRYLKARSLNPTEWEAGSDPGLSATIHFRERDEDLSLRGQQCRVCSAIQFPPQRVCESCYAKDDFDLIRLSDRVGQVVTHTFDFFFPTPDPPTIVTVTEVEGARIHLQLVDCDPKAMRNGIPVEFVFRRIHQSGGRPNYYWKGMPVPE